LQFYDELHVLYIRRRILRINLRKLYFIVFALANVQILINLAGVIHHSKALETGFNRIGALVFLDVILH